LNYHPTLLLTAADEPGGTFITAEASILWLWLKISTT
jgi:hypothetical protein